MAWCSIAGNENYGKLITCAEDRTVRLWHVSEALQSLNLNNNSPIILDPVITFRYHTDIVEDVDWHNFDVNMIGSCGDDGNICLWDIRKDPTVPIHVISNAHGHGEDVNGMEFHLTNEFLFATGGSDKVVKLWDVRNLKSPLQTLEGHTDQVYTVHWSPFDESLLASCSADRRIALWDLSRIGCEQSVEDAEDGPPELLFLHGGHTSRVNDFSWNPNYEWCIAGVSEDNAMQIWCPAEDVYAEDDDDDEEEEEHDLATKQRAEILKDDELE
jgi:histone-binding protein RBBP4